ncbi:hypothetical protein PAXINDRAFT_67127 [Paxillus involutus ATCC 200175]|nr:hypothetical protein PAXINDRAFT_67127 [Paxillus involutus ATCC 200175]
MINSSANPSPAVNSRPSRFDSIINPTNPSNTHRPRPYKPDLTPVPSPLCLHCLTKHHLLKWLPDIASPHIANNVAGKPLNDNKVEHILSVIGASWADSIKELYGTGLLVFHVYCNIHDIPDVQRIPISHNLLSAFLACCTGALSGLTISNYAAALRAWHVLHGLAWNINEPEYKALLEGATRLTPASSKQPKRSPFTATILEKFREVMNLEDPHNAVIFACLISSFYCIARLGEFTVSAISRFDPTKHISHSALTITHNHNDLPVMKFTIPATKTFPNGEEVHCTPHSPPSPTSPKSAIETHFRINQDKPHAHLFSWKHPSGAMRPLCKKEVTKRIDSIAKAHPDLLDLKGHSLQIRGTLHYLHNGVPFNVVKTMGRWSSELFTLYLQHHALVLTPFLQHQPELMHNLRQYILPPIH